MIRLAAICLVFWAQAAVALELLLPEDSALVHEEREEDAALELPTERFDGAHVPSRRAEGTVTRRTWRISSGPLSSS